MFVFFVLIFWSDFLPGWFLWVIIQFQHLLEMSLGTSVPLAPRVCPTGAFLGLPSVPQPFCGLQPRRLGSYT